MPWFDPLFEPHFFRWLRQASEGRYTQRVPSDPFATSMRDLDDVAPNLHAVRAGVALEGQRHTDLRAAQLVEDGRLTTLGDQVLDKWIHYGIDNDDYASELPRQLALVCEALVEGNAFYAGVADFWREKFARYGSAEVISNWQASFAISYLSRTDSDGYSPLGEYEKEAGATLFAWDGDALRHRVVAAVSAGDQAIAGVNRIVDAIDGLISRGKARKLFLMALDLAESPREESASPKLDTWTVPLTSTTRTHSPIPDAVKQKCLDILGDYASRLDVDSTPDYLDLLNRRKNVVFFGPPGTGKTYAGNRIADYWRGRYGEDKVFSLTFHPSYGYEDFVWGWRPNADVASGFSPTPGALLRACSAATDGSPVLLLIDEINRADTARVFGELITYIEADKRGIPFRIAQDADTERTIPSSLFVLGTMNTADRSVSLMDVALRRRFAFVEFVPDGGVFDAAGWLSAVDDVSLEAVLEVINTRLAKVGVEPDRAIGHALLALPKDAPNPAGALKERFQYDIHPLIVDYCFADRTRVEQVLKPLVTADGRFKQLDDAGFLAGLRELIGGQQPAAHGANQVVESPPQPEAIEQR